MYYIRRITFAALLVLILSLGVLSVANAQEVSVIEPGQTVTGTLNATTDSYTFSASQGAVFVISMEAEFDTLIEVNDTSGNQVDRDDDGGEGLNSRLIFTVPADGTYTIIARGYSEDAVGEYTLSLNSFSATPIEFGIPLPVTITEEDNALYFSFEGKEGDIVNIYGDSGGALNTALSLYGPDNVELAYNDDGGESSDPAIRRAMLPGNGTYTIALSPYGEGNTGSLTLLLELTQMVSLDAGAQIVTLGSDYDTEVFSFTATAGARYRVTIRVVEGETASPSVEIEGEDYSYFYASASNVEELSFVFTADSGGLIPVTLRNWSEATLEVSIGALLG